MGPFSDKGYDHVKQAFFSGPAADKRAAVAAAAGDGRTLEVEEQRLASPPNRATNDFVPVDEVFRFRAKS